MIQQLQIQLLTGDTQVSIPFPYSIRLQNLRKRASVKKCPEALGREEARDCAVLEQYWSDARVCTSEFTGVER